MKLSKNEYETTTQLLDSAYKNVRMASFAIDCIIEKIENKKLEELLRKQNDFYLDTTEILEKISTDLKHKPVDINIFLKGTSFTSIKMKAMMNPSAQHLAEMLVQGTTMGITDMMKSKSDFETNNTELKQTVDKIIENEEAFVDSLKTFL